MIYGRKLKSQIIKQDMKIIEKSYATENAIVLGHPGGGRAHHPWDDLKPCICGSKEHPLLMYNKDTLYSCGGKTSSVFVICPLCGRHTAHDDISKVIDDWNNDNLMEENK